jgi:hypothetical protein
MLTNKQDHNLLNGLAIAQNAPKVSHLFFADDNIIFCKASKAEATQLKEVFEEYQRISGQKINMAKSKMTFSPKILPAIKEEFHGILPLTISPTIVKYLGMPTKIGQAR